MHFDVPFFIINLYISFFTYKKNTKTFITFLSTSDLSFHQVWVFLQWSLSLQKIPLDPVNPQTYILRQDKQRHGKCGKLDKVLLIRVSLHS